LLGIEPAGQVHSNQVAYLPIARITSHSVQLKLASRWRWPAEMHPPDVWTFVRFAPGAPKPWWSFPGPSGEYFTRKAVIDTTGFSAHGGGGW